MKLLTLSWDFKSHGAAIGARIATATRGEVVKLPLILFPSSSVFAGHFEGSRRASGHCHCKLRKFSFRVLEVMKFCDPLLFHLISLEIAGLQAWNG